VKSVSPVSDDPLTVYDDIVAAKRNKRERRDLEKLRTCVASAYRRYGRWKQELQRLRGLGARLSHRQREVLLGCYEGAHIDRISRNPRDRLYAKIRALCTVCPYCTIAPPKTLDHYLPRNDYPEFSVLPINLVPACSGCNTSRGFRDRTGARALIHPYFDTIPNERLLVATIRIVDGAPDATFSVDRTQAKDKGFADLYERHVDLLRLHARYRRWALSEYGLSSILSTTRVWARGMPRDELRHRLEEQAHVDEATLGANHFKVVLHRGAAASDEFLDYCLGRTP
jgi:5-methylcytosine-specific restriction endonuclease McrA